MKPILLTILSCYIAVGVYDCVLFSIAFKKLGMNKLGQLEQFILMLTWPWHLYDYITK